MKTYNIKFPLEDDANQNKFLNLNSVSKDAYTSDLLLLLLTNKGERLYMPNYGTNLIKFLFEPNDNITISNLEQEIKNTVKEFIPSLSINNINIAPEGEDFEGNKVDKHQINIKLNITFSEDSFSQNDDVIISF